MRKPIAILFSVIALVTGGCKKTNTPALGGSMQTTDLNSTPGNLLSNSNFSLWSSASNFFTDWNVQATQMSTIRQATGGIQFTGNAAGTYYIYQRIKVEKRKFYKVSVTASYTLNDYAPAGIYVMDSSMLSISGKVEKVYSSATQESWQFIFYSKKAAEVTVVIGFLNGINGNFTFTDPAVTEYKYQPRISGSSFSTYLGKKFPLLFTPAEYDSTIDKIGDYVNSVLLSRYAYYADTVESPVLDGLIGADTNYAYFNTYRHTPEQITDSYCQKSSLSLGEVLANEFNIPVRQIYMSFAGIGKHQFLEYWNPFAGKWIIIDPCFNTRYKKDNVLLGTEDFDQATAKDLMVRYGQYYYYLTTDDLVTLWLGMDELIVKDYYTITFPFS